MASPVFGQMTQDPTSWKYEVKKKSATQYELIFHLSLKPGWHIWSINPGGDGYLIPPTFEFTESENFSVEGKCTERGNVTTTVMDGIDGKVNYLSGKIDYVQVVTVKKHPLTIKGKNTFQVCNDKMCLPPRDKNFSFQIK